MKLVNLTKSLLLSVATAASLSACEASSSSPPSPAENQGIGTGEHVAYWLDETDSWEESILASTFGKTTTYNSALTYPKIPKTFYLSWVGIHSDTCSASLVDSISKYRTLTCTIDKESNRFKVVGFELALSKNSPGTFTLQIQHEGHTYSITMEQVPYHVKTALIGSEFRPEFLESEFRYLFTIELKELSSYQVSYPTDQVASFKEFYKNFDSKFDLGTCAINQAESDGTSQFTFPIKIVSILSPDIRKHWAKLASDKVQASVKSHKLYVFTNDEKAKSLIEARFSYPERKTVTKACGRQFDPDSGRFIERGVSNNPYIGRRDVKREISFTISNLVLKKESKTHEHKTYGEPQVQTLIATYTAPNALSHSM